MFSGWLSTLPFWWSSLFLAAVSFMVTFVTIPVTIRLSRRWGLLDYPQRNHPAILHQKPIPRGGGIPLFLGFLVTFLLFFPWNRFLLAILLGSFTNVLVGTLDDRHDLSPWLRLLITLPLSALPLILAGFQITISNPLGASIFTFQWLELEIPFLGTSLFFPEALVIILWVVWVCNMVNWSKGASQLPGVAVIAFLTLAGVALKYQSGNLHQLVTAQLAFVLAAVCAALLPYNFPPEKIFPGFGGSTFIGFGIAALAILSGGKLAAAILVLGVPAADMVISIWRRLTGGKSPLHGDRGHLYHLLLEAGLTKRQVIVFYWTVTLILGLFALSLERSQKIFAIALVTVVTTAFFFLIRRSISQT